LLIYKPSDCHVGKL